MAFAVHKQVTLIGTGDSPTLLHHVYMRTCYVYHVHDMNAGSDVDVCLSHYGHCNYLSSRHACIFYNKVHPHSLTHTHTNTSEFTFSLSLQATGEYELLNYSDHGSVVDGVLYSCDFSDKNVAEVDTKDSSTDLRGHNNLKTDKAKMKIEGARKNLRDQTSARRALEGALNLTKHSGKEEGTGEGTRRTTYNSSVVSIPLVLSRTKKLSGGVPAMTKTPTKTRVSSVPGTPEKQPSSPGSSQKTLSTALLCPDPPSTPCLCRRSASCLVGTNRKGWEGTATLYHGSRLRFGCLQFVLSVAGRPGHTELLDSLLPLLYHT